jgi:hypothetical protein
MRSNPLTAAYNDPSQSRLGCMRSDGTDARSTRCSASRRAGTLFPWPYRRGALLRFRPLAYPPLLCEMGPFVRVLADTDKKFLKFLASAISKNGLSAGLAVSACGFPLVGTVPGHARALTSLGATIFWSMRPPFAERSRNGGVHIAFARLPAPAWACPQCSCLSNRQIARACRCVFH